MCRPRSASFRADLLLGGILLPLFFASPAAAQVTPPDAGQTLRETRPVMPVSPRPVAVPTITIPAEKDAAADPSQRLTVSSIRIEGNVHLPTAELHALVADLEGREQSLGELRAGVRRITSHYRERGYIVARAFVPAQEIDGGVVVVRVLEGQLNGASVVNRTLVKTGVLQRVLDAQHLKGKVITSATTDRGLLLLADLPGVGKVAGKLHPGQEVGTSDLIVTAEPGRRAEGSVSVDNYGNRYTGRNRLNGQVQFNSLAGIGDRLSLQGSVTDQALLYGRAAYDLPVGGDGLRLGAAASSSSYELGKEFARLDASGGVKTYGAYALYPLVRGLNRNLWLTGNVEHRDLTDTIRSVKSRTRKGADVATVQVYGDAVDALLGGGYTSFSLSVVGGRLDVRSPGALAIDRAGPRTQGDYAKVTVNVSRLQALTRTTSLALALSAQKASKNLDSSEKFVVGGIYGVRAYPQGEGAGDTGWLADAELRHRLLPGLQLAAFYDIGRVRFSEDAYLAGRNTAVRSGVGASVTGEYGPVTARVTVATRATGPSVTAPDRNPVAWASLGYRF
ncbi:MAG: ShlB/FhaC/HecB family hemolysin secretion/activation protein [Sphingomonas phyllosphaerae]